MIFGPTPSQTVGPFFAIGLPFDGGAHAAPGDVPGAITISGAVLDGAGEPVHDALVETWQADPWGRFVDLHGWGGRSDLEGFLGFARVATDENGNYVVVTVKPGPTPGPGGGAQAPHIDVSVFARGLLHRCVTRIYFADEEELNAADRVLGMVPEARRGTLLARPTDGGYRFDIRLQGPGETVFFDL